MDAGAPTLAPSSDSFAPRGGRIRRLVPARAADSYRPGPPRHNPPSKLTDRRRLVPARTAGHRIPKFFTGRMGWSPRSVGLHMNHRRTDGGCEGWGTR